jgi:hypothetical protein
MNTEIEPFDRHLIARIVKLLGYDPAAVTSIRFEWNEVEVTLDSNGGTIINRHHITGPQQ